MRSIDRTGRRAITRHDVTSSMEWDETRGMLWTHVRLAGTPIATFSDPVGTPVNNPGGTQSLAPPVAPSLYDGGRTRMGPQAPAAIAMTPAALAALLLALELERRRRRGQSLRLPALASTTLVAFVLMLGEEARAAGAPLSGDLNGDQRLDAADALLMALVMKGQRIPTSAELSAGDIAPLDLAPTSPSAINAADLLLVTRALRGEDVDGDTLPTATELANGTSPFRADTDRDGLRDDAELLYGTDPTQGDADGDGLLDAGELIAGADPEDRDSDGDGWLDGEDPDPRGGLVYRHGDHLGSTTLTTRSDGELITRAVYRPFGGVVPATTSAPTHAPGEFGFTGQRYEKATGIYDYGARFYDPALGRFLTPDTVVPGGGLDPQGLNRYAYVRNNPISRIDPTGHLSFDIGLGFGTVSYSTGQSFGWDWGPSFGASFSTGSYGNGWGGSFMLGWEDGFSADVSSWFGSNYFGAGFERGNAYAASQFGSIGDAYGIASRALRSELGLAGELGIYDRARDGDALSRLVVDSRLTDAWAEFDQRSNSYVVSSDIGTLRFGQGRSVLGHEFWHAVDESSSSFVAAIYDMDAAYPETVRIPNTAFTSYTEHNLASLAKEFRASMYEARTQQYRGFGAALSTDHYVRQYGAPLQALGVADRVMGLEPRLP